MSFYKIHAGRLSLSIKVGANASKNEIKPALPTAEYLTVKIRAVREKGKANEELIAYLSSILKVPASQIELLRGHTASLKIISIATQDPQKLLKILGI